MINIYQPSLGEEEVSAVRKVFQSNWLGYGRSGTKQDEFVNKFASAIGDIDTNCMTTISCCSEALFQSIGAYISPGDEVIMPSISFIATANAVVHYKGIPVFCDVDRHTLNPSVSDIEKCITDKTRIVVIIHYAGVPCDIKGIVTLCKQHNIILIEDNASSPFAKVDGQNTGTFGDMGLWSFDPMKIITTGDGGMIYSKDLNILQHIKYNTYLGLKSSGSTNAVDKKWWEFNIETPGSKSTMNDLSAAIGIQQLQKLQSFMSVRKRIHKLYNELLKDIKWLSIPPSTAGNVESSYYMYYIQTHDATDRDNLAKYLRDHGVYTTFRYYPLHWVEYFSEFKSPCELSNSEYAAMHTLNLPLHQDITESDVRQIVKLINLYKK
jgi:aminotransferase